MDDNPMRKGIPKEAWAAIGVIGAAAVTGLVTIIIDLGGADGTSVSAITTEPASTTNSASSNPVAGMMGSWLGDATTVDGGQFEISLDIDRECQLNEHCGAIEVSNGPCHGQVFLDAVEGGEVALRVENFDARSDPNICQAGGGEHFRLRPDGKLGYRTTYEPLVSGVLERIG